MFFTTSRCVLLDQDVFCYCLHLDVFHCLKMCFATSYLKLYLSTSQCVLVATSKCVLWPQSVLYHLKVCLITSRCVLLLRGMDYPLIDQDVFYYKGVSDSASVFVDCLKMCYAKSECESAIQVSFVFLFSMADRSFSDLTQYPVMPWVVQDYTSPVLSKFSLKAGFPFVHGRLQCYQPCCHYAAVPSSHSSS